MAEPSPASRPAPPPASRPAQPPRAPPAPAAVRDDAGREDDRLVIGTMTGTSIDGLDAALIRIRGRELRMRVELVDHVAAPFPAELAARLRALAEQTPLAAGAIAALARDFALFHVDALRRFFRGSRIDLIAIHGQTVFHAPPLSWQLFQPAPVAQAFGVPVVCDLRAADLAHGGQGAPITPLADLILFGDAREARTVINLGGFVNLTRLGAGRSPGGISGGDVCACNQILDAVARRLLDAPYDRDGQAALAGTAAKAPTAALVKELRAQAGAGRSLGTGDELAAWLDRFAGTPPADLARSACAAIAQVVCAAARPADRLVLAGGGVRNRALLAEFVQRAGVPVAVADDLGVPAGLREAMAMAVLGALCQDGVPITLPQITGASPPPVAGLWCLP